MRTARIVCAVALLAQLLLGCQASLMAIDLGSEFIKVSLVKPGRTPISVVVNEMSRRKSPAMVGLINEDRVIGEEAFTMLGRYPERIVQFATNLLGRLPDDPTIERTFKDFHLPHKVVAHPTRGVASIQYSDGTVLSAEELVASLLQYCKSITEAQAGGPVLDAVITVPSFWGASQRQALLDAAGLAGLNVLGLINTHAAAALQFGIERDFTNKTQDVIFYDMGSSSTIVSLVRFTTYTVKEAGKPKTLNQLEVRDVEWDAHLGGNHLDMALAQHFAAEFSEKVRGAPDVRGVPKAMVKLRKQVRRTKEVLSANSGAPFSVEELHDGADFQSSISREKFEELAGGFFEAAAQPLRRILDRNGLKPSDVDAVELLGGGSRVPRLQVALSEALGGRPLDRHLDADEAIVMGAGLFGANLSTSFRLRKFGLADVSMFGIKMTIDDIKLPKEVQVVADPKDAAAAAGGGDDAPGPFLSVRPLLPAGKKLPIKRLVTFHNLTGDPIKFSLAYNDTAPHGLPPGVASPELGSWQLTGVPTVVARYNTSGAVTLKFEADFGGVLGFSGAEAVVEYEVMEEKIVEVKDEEAAAAGNSTEAAAEGSKSDGKDEEKIEGKEKKEEKKMEKKKEEVKADGSGGDDKNGTAKAAPAVKRVMVPKKKTARVALDATGGLAFPHLGGADLEAAGKRIRAWLAAEGVKRDNAKAKNDLEAYIIATRAKLDEDETLKKVTTEEARDAFRSSLTDAEDWLYSDGEAEAAAAFRAKLKTLTAVGDPMTRRAAEYEDRPKVVDAARKAVELDIKVVRGWEASKPYINETERAGALAKLEAFEGWLADKMAEQAKRADTEEPAFTAGQVQVEYAKAAAEFQRLSRRKPPKPPAAAPGAAAGGANGTATNGTTAGANSTSSSAGEEAPGAEQQQQQEGEAEAEGGGAADGEGQQQQGEAEADEELPTHEEL